MWDTLGSYPQEQEFTSSFQADNDSRSDIQEPYIRGKFNVMSSAV